MESNEQITIFCNKSYLIERDYVYNYVFKDRLNLNYNVQYFDKSEHDYIIIKLPNNLEFKIADIFFNTDKQYWLKEKSLINSCIQSIDLKNTIYESLIQKSDLPILFSNENNDILNPSFIGFDIFGAIFYLITGYEEYVIKERNQFGNFPYELSLSFNASIIKRPLVDEYINYLWGTISYFQSSLKIRKKDYEFIITHDIDNPFLFYNNPFFTHFKASLGDIIKRFNLKQLRIRNQSYFQNGKNDPFNTYDWLMKISENHGKKSIFYFKNSLNSSLTDHPYKINTKALNKILTDIDRRNHLIGFHPSYYSYNNEQVLNKEISAFRNHCLNLNIKQNIDKVRQHYLRYEAPITSQIQENNHFVEDSTLGYSNITGFRRGTCHPFKIFDVKNKRTIDIVEKPLILMEVSLPFESNSKTEQFDIVKNLVDTCKFYNGNFVLLWHNQALMNESDKQFYENIINLC